MDASPTLDRSRYELEVEDTFSGPELDRSLWLPHYLAHWSTRELAAARYRLRDGALELLIEADQPAWAPEWDGELRVSSFQTGAFSGPVGSSIGQARFRDGIVVRSAQEAAALYTPQFGLFELRARALPDPANMVALWMIGVEDQPERSGEILVCEIFGRDIGSMWVNVGMGIRPWSDPKLTDAFSQEPLLFDARQAHDYAAEWTPDGVAFYVDDRLVKVVDQSPDYPMLFLLNVYEFRDSPELPSPPAAYPKVFRVERFRGWRPTSGPGARPAAFSRSAPA
jgi:hypothetical protein